MSIAALNEVTGADRRTLKKILKGTTPVGVHANGNLCTIAQAKRLHHRHIHRHAQAVVEDRAPAADRVAHAGFAEVNPERAEADGFAIEEFHGWRMVQS